LCSTYEWREIPNQLQLGEKPMKLLCTTIVATLAVTGTSFSAEPAIAWGYNGYGQCDFPAGETFVQVVGGGYHTIGLRADGTAIALGWNDYGQCDVPAGETFVQVAAGGLHAIGLRADGTAIAWGDNGNGQCDVPAGETFVQVDGGDYNTIGLRADGTAIAWGNNVFGQCDVPAGETFVQVAAGDYHTIGLRADGTAIAWGYNNYGECDVPAGETFVQVTGGANHTIGLRADGTAIAWGWNYYSQCIVPAGETFFVQVDAGYNHTIGLRADGTAIAWGYNYNGQCDVPAGETFMQVAAGGFHTIGLQETPIDPCGLPLGSCPEDVDGNSIVAIGDILAIVSDFGDCGDGTYRPDADVSGDCCVSVLDLLAVVSAWGNECSLVGACCLPDGGCSNAVTQATCTEVGGSYQGVTSTCKKVVCPVPAAGDECSSAFLAIDGANPFDTLVATASGNPPTDELCSDTYLNWNSSRDVWFLYVPSATDTVNFSTCDANSYDTSIALYEGTCNNLVACNGDGTSGTGCQAYYSALDYSVSAGSSYYIRIGGFNGVSGLGTLTID
jgi:alpha-tubulin suppressor-like RCC1 family protein